MRVSQLTKVMPDNHYIVIIDTNAPIGKERLYGGEVRGIKRDDPINKMHISCIFSDDDKIIIAVERAKTK
jgi:hypothetical protein